MSSNADQQQEASYPLTPMQQGMCFHSLYAPEEGLYVQQIVCTLPEPLDVDRLQRAWQQVVARHASCAPPFSSATPQRRSRSSTRRPTCSLPCTTGAITPPRRARLS